ncbi:RNase HII [Diaminobutyricimonas aerilata]|uniref:Ribonuclease n=1 Tax=Diaminobutyricimonas aerilata TaxID=1162967 RepID=A0A2M9CIT3_9MICO|nr:ribonuclease HII [Diaminobutyricimonas aerilata]PJJ71772.1 RNase HII [Diaminobutyricimonas aerilata]
MTVADPTLRVEKKILREGARYVIGMDEVGRGAIAGPLAIGVCVFDASVKRMPRGLRDSKMLSEKRREELAPQARKWALHSAVGVVGNDEIDRLGLTACLGLAAARAIRALADGGVPLQESVVILDGSWDYLNPALEERVNVHLRVKADRDCASVAAASVVAKVHRDRFMIEAHDDAPAYGWSGNKGYASTAHYAAIDTHGPHGLHRVTWLRQPSLFDELGESIGEPLVV